MQAREQSVVTLLSSRKKMDSVFSVIVHHWTTALQQALSEQGSLQSAVQDAQRQLTTAKATIVALENAATLTAAHQQQISQVSLCS